MLHRSTLDQFTDHRPAPSYDSREKIVTVIDDNGFAHEVRVVITDTYYGNRLNGQHVLIHAPKAEFSDLEYDVLQLVGKLFNPQIQIV